MPVCAAPLAEPHRYYVMYGGRNGVKSWSVARHLLIRGAKEPIRCLCCRETMITIQDSVHALLEDQIKAMQLGAYYNVQKTAIYGTNGTRFVYAGLRGLKNDKTALKSYESFDVAWVEEAQSVSKSSWTILIPTIRKAHSQIFVTFNPELETDDTFRRFILNPPPDCVVLKTSYRDNPWLSEEAKADMAHLKATDPDEFEHVYEGACTSQVEGAIFAKELRAVTLENRETKVQYDPTQPVYTFWDIGDRYNSIWFVQTYPLEYHVIDYLDDEGLSLDRYFKLLSEKPYIYAKHTLPNDARSPQLATGKSIEQQAKSIMGGDKIAVLPKLSLKQQIAAARLIFPRCWFDAEKCGDGLQGLRHYRWPPIGLTGVEHDKPLHDWASHPGSAFQYFAAGIKDQQYSAIQLPKPAPMPEYAGPWS